MKNKHVFELKDKKINVLLLCGGLGSRISKYTKRTPKPLIKIGSHPFLYYLIKNLSRYNYKNFYLLTYYKNEKFVFFKKKYQKLLNVKIKLISEKEKLDTGGAVLNATKKINNKNDYMILNGDTYLDTNFDYIYEEYKKKNSIYMPLIKSKKQSFKLNGMKVDKKGKVKFSPKSNYMNSGVYLMNRKHLKNFNYLKKFSLENDLLFKKIKVGEVYGNLYFDNFIDIGSYSSLKKVNNFIKYHFHKKKILFLDRDNTIIFDKGYTHKVEDIRLKKKNISFIKNNYKEYLKILVTNQSGIGKGFFNYKDFKIFMTKLVYVLSN